MENVVITQEQLVQEERQYAGPANTDHDQVNDDMELDDDHDDNIIEDDGANALINDAFNVRMRRQLMTLKIFMIYLHLRRQTNRFLKAPA